MKDTYINGYRLLGPLSNDSSGNGKWGYAEKNGIEVFIKEFLTPKYPLDPTLFTEKNYRRNLDKCMHFQRKKIRLYKALMACESGNVIPVLDFFRYGTKYYMVTEKVEHVTLSIGELYKIPLSQKLLLIKLISYSVNDLHRHGIVHADLKPDNILIKKTKAGGLTAKIIDFDGSFMEDAVPSEEDMQGDLVYMAPETFLYVSGEKARISKAIDVFALGVFFFQLLSGKIPPFEGGDYEYPFEAVLDKKRIVFPGDMPVGFEKLLKKMLEKNSRKRITMDGVVKWLDRY